MIKTPKKFTIILKINRTFSHKKIKKKNKKNIQGFRGGEVLLTYLEKTFGRIWFTRNSGNPWTRLGRVTRSN